MLGAGVQGPTKAPGVDSSAQAPRATTPNTSAATVDVLTTAITSSRVAARASQRLEVVGDGEFADIQPSRRSGGRADVRDRHQVEMNATDIPDSRIQSVATSVSMVPSP